MHKDITNYTDDEDTIFSITAYLASITGTLEAHADGMVKYQDLGPEYFSKEVKKVIDSLSAVRAKLVEHKAWSIEL